MKYKHSEHIQNGNLSIVNWIKIYECEVAYFENTLANIIHTIIILLYIFLKYRNIDKVAQDITLRHQ